jgi:SAM-dependent methyltransferase
MGTKLNRKRGYHICIMLDSTVSCYEDHAEAYDRFQEAVVPGYREMLELVGDASRRYLQPNCRIIDLGCGTGNASLAVLEKLPAKIFLIDGSQKMVAAAERKIGKTAVGVVLGRKVANISEEGWSAGLEAGTFDAIISTLVLEHLPFDRYRCAIRESYQLLKPGGWLIAVEGYDEPDSDMLVWFSEEMVARSRKLDWKFSESIVRLRDEKEIHYYCSKAEKQEWWREAGFYHINVLWQYLCIALMVGRKPLQRDASTAES